MRRKMKKSAKRRGRKTHGYGSMKKNRGSGNKGGKGNAGTGKRADSKKPSINPKDYFGRHGFVSRRKEHVAINLFEIELKINDFESKGAIERKSGIVNVNLKKAGIDKLLGLGNVSAKYHVIVAHASAGAVSKVEAAGGSVEILKTNEKSEKSSSGKGSGGKGSSEGAEA